MKSPDLTSCKARAHNAPMETKVRGSAGAKKMLAAALVPLALSGCITVNAPDKPIVIELNINIKQEVLYRIEGEVQKTIDENSGIF